MTVVGEDMKVLQQYVNEEGTGEADVSVVGHGLWMKRGHTSNFGGYQHHYS
jgi:hypothetical protein